MISKTEERENLFVSFVDDLDRVQNPAFSDDMIMQPS